MTSLLPFHFACETCSTLLPPMVIVFLLSEPSRLYVLLTSPPCVVRVTVRTLASWVIVTSGPRPPRPPPRPVGGGAFGSTTIIQWPAKFAPWARRFVPASIKPAA